MGTVPCFNHDGYIFKAIHPKTNSYNHTNYELLLIYSCLQMVLLETNKLNVLFIN